MHRSPTGSWRRWRAGVLLAVALCFAAAGCGTVFDPSFTPPTVAVDGFDISRAGLFSQELLVRVIVTNRMAEAMTIEAVDLELEVNGHRLGEGTLLKSIPLDGEGTVATSVPIKVKTQDIFNAIAAMARRPRLSFAVSGHLHVSGSKDSDPRSVSFDDDGEFSLPFMPAHSVTT